MYYTNNHIVENHIPNYLIHSSTYYVVVTDLEGRYSFYNEAFAYQFRFLKDNLLGEPFAITIHQDDIEKCNQAAFECITNPGQSVNVFIRKPENTSSKEDSFYLSSWDFTLLQDDKKKPIGIICIGHDITETEKNARLAKKLEQDLNKVVDEMEDGFFACNFEWEYIQINKAASELISKTKEELIGLKIWLIAPEDDSKVYTQNYKKAMYERTITQFEEYMPSIDKYFLVTAYPSPYGINVFFRDISKERRISQVLKNSEKKLKALLDSTNSANILLDTKGFIISFNKAAESFARLLYRKQLELGMAMKQLVDKRQKKLLNSFFIRALRGEHLLTDIELFFDDSTTGLWFEVEYSPAYDSEGNLFGVSFNASNVDEKRRAYDKIKAQKQELEKIAFMQSHSLRKSIVNILDILYLINEECRDEVPENLAPYLKLLEQVGKHTDEILYDISAQLNNMLK